MPAPPSLRTSTAISSLTSTAPPSLRTSAAISSLTSAALLSHIRTPAAVSSVTVATSVSPSTVDLSYFSSTSEQLPIVVESSTPQSSTVVAVGGSSNVCPSIQLPPVTSGGAPSGSGSEAITGTVVAVVVILIVVSVIVAAVLIACRVNRREKRAATGEQHLCLRYLCW